MSSLTGMSRLNTINNIIPGISYYFSLERALLSLFYVHTVTALLCSSKSNSTVWRLQTNLAKQVGHVLKIFARNIEKYVLFSVTINGLLYIFSKKFKQTWSFLTQVSFNVMVELKGCLAGPRRFSLRPAGFQDTLEIELESQCVCDCHQTPEANSTYCSRGRGALECGACVCDPGFVGPKCECTEGQDEVSDCRWEQESRSVSCEARRHSLI